MLNAFSFLLSLSFVTADQIKQSVEGSLVNLQTSYIDSLVLHSPLETLDRTKKAWQVLESFVKEGKVKKLGISNCYDFNYFEQLYNYAEIKPSVLQNRFYSDSNFDVKLREFCKVKGIAYQSCKFFEHYAHFIILKR